MKPYANPQWLADQYSVRHKTTVEIGRECGVSDVVIGKWLKRFGIPALPYSTWIERKGRPLYQNKDWLESRYLQQRLSMTDIARECGVDNTTILKYLRRCGIPRRSGREIMLERYRVSPQKFVGNHNPKTEEHKAKLRAALMGRKLPEAVRAKLKGINAGKRNPFYGKKHPKEVMDRILRTRAERPTRPEKILIDLFPSALRYVGNFAYWKTFPNGKHKNPDFKVPGQNKVVEVFGGKGYFHTDDEAVELIKQYKEIGMNCLILWDKDICHHPQLAAEQVNAFLSA